MIESITPQAEKVRRAWRVAEEAYVDIIDKSQECMRYVLNDPYSQSDKTEAQKHKKPLLKYTIMIPYLAVIIGNEQLSRRRALIKTRSNDPEMINLIDIIQGRWNAINDEQNVEEKIQTAFSDALIMPVGGYIVRSFKVNDQGYLDYDYEVANNMRVKLDPETKTSDQKLDKCRWLIKEGWERPEYIMDRWNMSQEDFDEKLKIGWWQKITGYVQRFKESDYSTGPHYDKENDLYRILEMQERTQHRFVRVYGGEGFAEVPREDYKTLKLNNPDLEFLGEIDREVIHVTTIIPALNDLLVNDKDSEVPTRNFDVFRVGSYSYTNQITEAISLVFLLMDIQDDINNGKSQNRDYLGQILAGITVIYGEREKDAFELLKKKGNQPNLVIKTKSPNAKIERLKPGTVPSELLINTSDSMMHGDKIAQTPAAMRGESERSGESGVLFQQKVDRAAAAINPYYKNVSDMRKAIVEDYIDNFAYVYSEYDRMIDVKSKNEQGESIWDKVFINLKMASEVINEVKNASMYVELDEGEDNFTAREENFNRLMAIAEVVGNVNPAYVDVITLLNNAPIKDIDKWIEHIKAVMGAQADDADAQKQMEAEKARIDIAKTASEIQPNNNQNVAQT